MAEQEQQAKALGRLMRRRELAAHLREKFGMRLQEQTLATYAVKGSGPPYRRIGRDVVYEVDAAESWAEARISPPRCSTSEPATASEAA